MTDEYREIRPFSDQELPSILKELGEDQSFHEILCKLSNRELNVRQISKKFSEIFSNVNSIKAFQSILAPFVEQIVEKTTSNFSFSGAENILGSPALFISNHRDIALDSLFLNLILYKKGFKTARIAIGDNLLDGGYLEKVMKLNKSFVVHREPFGFKETIKVISRLSSYINNSLTSDNESIWISQKEGRANDGWDLTDLAVLKMLYFTNKKNFSIQEWLSKANIIPVSISYEYDPLDILKASRLLNSNESKKLEISDDNNQDILEGIVGQKGKVHLSFGKKIALKINSLETLKISLDKAIIKGYKLWPSNVCAAKYLKILDSKEKEIEINFTKEYEKNFFQRFEDLDSKILDKVLHIYAAPVLNKLQNQD